MEKGNFEQAGSEQGPCRDVAVKMRFYNNQLVSRRLRAGLTIAQISNQTGIHPASYCRMERVNYRPFSKKVETNPDELPAGSGVVINGATHRWLTDALRIAEYWKTLPEELFPRVLAVFEKAAVEFSMDVDAMQLLSEFSHKVSLPMENMESAAERQLLITTLNAACGYLSPYEQKVLRLRYAEDMSYEEIGAELNRAAETIRRCEHKALRRLRHPRLRTPLEEMVRGAKEPRR